MQDPNPDDAAPVQPDSVGAAALEALQKARAKQDADKAAAGEDITSLNKLLQWSTAQSDNSAQSSTSKHVPAKSPAQLERDKEWLDAAFPDMYAEIKALVKILKQQDLDGETVVDALEGLQEYFLDLNYAVNIEKIDAVDPVLSRFRSERPAIRAAAIWVVGTAMRDLQEVKDIFMRHDIHVLLAQSLKDDDDKVRAKAVMASSALLRHSTTDIQSQFDEAGGSAALHLALSDANIQVRRRARFFLQHALATGNATFVEQLITDRNAVVALSTSVQQLDVNDVADVEAAVGALTVLVETDLQGLLQVAPELPGIVDSLANKCDNPGLAELLSSLANRMG